ncbi:GNAT family N-acetyltransferase [Moritella sp. 5]|uniref:GNAT family N-acetyltransferase n=1 Tax=Moritella sp. 5 TaxID=2746231 RepID=UPI001BA9E565|nr:GNAT family N-acetyltransferase [Moritella sp. 5]QUM80862.1 GNAT family N-acetyltransferase [Moritella sp. 5]
MESERLKLAPPSLEFSEPMYEVIEDSRAEFSQFLPWVTESLTKDDVVKNTQEAIRNYEAFIGEFWFNIIEKETDSFIGAVGFIVRDGSVPFFEIGYWLQTSKTGTGYVSEAVKLVERYAFLEKEAKRVEIKMAGSNTKSQLVAKRCGYQLEAQLNNARRLPSGELDSTLIYAKHT